MGEKFSQYVSRSQMQTFEFGECSACHESVVRAIVKSSQRLHMFNPRPVGGTELDPAYDRHMCLVGKAVKS